MSESRPNERAAAKPKPGARQGAGKLKPVRESVGGGQGGTLGNLAERRKQAAQRRKQQERKRLTQLGLRVLLFVMVPTTVSAVYYGLVATPRYESVSEFTVHSADSRQMMTGLGQILGSLPGGSGNDTLLTMEYVASRSMLQKLIGEHGFIEHYASPDVDFFSRLPADADSEETYEYYQRFVTVEHDTISGLVSLHVQAFSAEAAESFAQAILRAGERKVNQISEQARQDAIAFATSEVDRAEKRVQTARKKLLEMQREGKMLNPLAGAEAVERLRASLEADLAMERARLRAMRATMSVTAPAVGEQSRLVSALEHEVKDQRGRLVESDEDSYNVAIAEFEPAILDKEFADQALRSATASLEVARADATRQHRYLVTVAEPSKPNAPTHPEVGFSVLTVFLLCLAGFGVLSLALASIREHSRI